MVLCSASSVVLATRDIGYYYKSYDGWESIIYPTIRYTSCNTSQAVNNNTSITAGSFTTHVSLANVDCALTPNYALYSGNRLIMYYYYGWGNKDGPGYQLYMKNDMSYGNYAEGSWCPDNG